MALDRLDPIVERREVKPLDEGPDEPGPVIGRQETVEIDRAELELAPVRALQARRARSELLGLWSFSRWEREERVVHSGNRSCDRPRWESPRANDSQPLSQSSLPSTGLAALFR